MTRARSKVEIETAFLSACHAELAALKPGNVHRHSAGHGMDVEHFERAAAAAAPFLAASGASVGKRILTATEASFAVTQLNVNLGIVLLCAPLAKAAEEVTFDVGLRRRLGLILQALDTQDAEGAYAAIRLVNPAGLGQVDDADVHGSSGGVTLMEAMHFAAERDRIANAYVTVYADVFDFALPLLLDARAEAALPELAVTTLHMALLAEFDDTHIARKYGRNVAAEIKELARTLKPQWAPVATAKSLERLLEFDTSLKTRGINPGTTADFVVTTLFVEGLLAKKAS